AFRRWNSTVRGLQPRITDVSQAVLPALTHLKHSLSLLVRSALTASQCASGPAALSRPVGAGLPRGAGSAGAGPGSTERNSVMSVTQPTARRRPAGPSRTTQATDRIQRISPDGRTIRNSMR